jgi:hypothetical protein
MSPSDRERRSRLARLAVRIAAAVAIGLFAVRASLAQACPVVLGPAGSPIHDGNPAFTITTTGVQAADLPLQITLQLATRSDFGGTLLVDSTVTSSGAANIVVPRLLPEHISVWWRARVRTTPGNLCFSDGSGPHTTSSWLTLISPNGLNGSTVDTKTPTFVWSSVFVRPPLAPWSYFLAIVRTIDGIPVENATLNVPPDTAFTSLLDLESNVSYRWYVVAKDATGDSVRVNSFASFVIFDPNAPIATVLYQNFPNPFPTARIETTCIWFDLAHPSDVKLDVLDLRGNYVAKLLPGRGLGPVLPPGRYGRAATGADSGCDERFTWDGRDAGGRTVPPGVYLVRFQGDGKRLTKPVVWKGR